MAYCKLESIVMYNFKSRYIWSYSESSETRDAIVLNDIDHDSSFSTC